MNAIFSSSVQRMNDAPTQPNFIKHHRAKGEQHSKPICYCGRDKDTGNGKPPNRAALTAITDSVCCIMPFVLSIFYPLHF